MKFLVTGGAGFIGSQITRSLIKNGGKVVILDNFSSGSIENIEDILDDVILIEGDIRDKDLLLRITKDVDYIFHEAAMTSVIESLEDPQKCNEININGSLNVFWAAFKNGVKRIIFASSSAVYGDSPILPKREDLKLTPVSPYAISKYVSELYLNFFWRIYNVPFVALRYFNVYGPYQNPSSPYSAVIPKFITALLKNETPIIFGDGEQTRDFIYVEDVVEANIKAVYVKNIEGMVFNIASGTATSVNILYKKIKELIGVEIEPRYMSARSGEIRHSYADISLAQKYLLWRPQYSLEKGLKVTIDWYKKVLSKL